MPPKKKVRDTRAGTDTFLLGQPRPTPITVTKPLTKGDMVRYVHWSKEQTVNKGADWESLLSCPLLKATSEASCFSVSAARPVVRCLVVASSLPNTLVAG